MKIISLNTWGGRAGKDELLTFFQKHNNAIDIFCLQEIWSAPYEDLVGKPLGGVISNHNDIMVYGKQEITNVLHDYIPYFRPHHLDNYGLFMLVHDGCTVIRENEIFVHKEKGFIPDGDVGHHARNIQYVSLLMNNKMIHILNFHGPWNGKGKDDSPDRIAQSEKIVAFIKTLDGEIILTGDFNLNPETDSIQILEKAGLRNLIKENTVTSTRTSCYTKPEKFADYMFVSSGIEVQDFHVLPDEVSDHAPMYIEYTLR